MLFSLLPAYRIQGRFVLGQPCVAKFRGDLLYARLGFRPGNGSEHVAFDRVVRAFDDRSSATWAQRVEVSMVLARGCMRP